MTTTYCLDRGECSSSTLRVRCSGDKMPPLRRAGPGVGKWGVRQPPSGKAVWVELAIDQV